MPRVVSRLRVDVTTEDGRLVATRDDLRADPQDWPASFSVYEDDPDRPRALLVRLRAYPDARIVPVSGGEGTVASEPDPTVTVDRTIRVPLVFGERGRRVVVLRGACVGRRACGEADPPLEPTMDRGVASVVGTFGAAGCEGVTLAEERACIPGGAFLLGDRFHRPSSTDGSLPFDARPERVVTVRRFAIDRDEVTVARFRSALARGFTPPTPVSATERDGPPGRGSGTECSWSATPRGREGYPLSCVTWDTARALCRFDGGDLPSEAQWEYAALASGRRAKTQFPWGDEPPDCDRAVYGRGLAGDDCITRGEGLPPSDTVTADVTPEGVRNLAGSLVEHVRDDHRRYTDPCWTGAPDEDPVCEVAPPPACVPDFDSLECRFGAGAPGIHKATRGASWFDTAPELRPVDRRLGLALTRTASLLVGFRCVYPAPGGTP